MKKLILILSLLLFCNLLSAQNERVIDSLKTVLSLKINDTTRINTLNELGWEFRRLNVDSAKFYTNKALVENIYDFKSGIIKSYMTLGTLSYYSNEYNEAINYFKKGYDISTSINSKIKTAGAANNIAIMYKILGNYDKSLEFNLLSLNLKQELGLKKEMVNSYLNIANLLYELNKYEEAISYCEKAIELAEVHYPKKKARIFNTMGSMYKEMENYSKALEYLTLAININLKNNDKLDLNTNYHNIGDVYVFMSKYDLAYKYFSKSILIKEELEDEIGIAKTNMAIGIMLFRKGDFLKSINYLNKSKKTYLKFSKLFELISINEHLSKSYIGLKIFSSAYYALSDSYQIKDSLYTLKSNETINNLQIKYQTQQKENQILLLSKENLEKKAALTQSRITIYSILGALVLALLMGYFYINKRKQQHKLALLENTVKTSEQEKSRIGKELHDGIAGTLIKLVHDSEKAQMQLSHKLLQTYNEVRNLSHQLDNTSVHGELFIERVLDIIPESNKDKQFNFKINPRHLEINEPHGTHVYRIIQELIANNLKYAKATITEIKIEFNNDSLLLHYTDNGIGISNFKKGNGFKNMEDRVQLMNGIVEINSQKEKGFELNIKVPYS